MDFRRIWLDKDAKSPSREGIGIWRPVPPTGYYALGEFRCHTLPRIGNPCGLCCREF